MKLPARADRLCISGMRAHDRGDYAAGAKLFLQARRLQPLSPSAEELLIRCLVASNQGQAAGDLIRQTRDPARKRALTKLRKALENPRVPKAASLEAFLRLPSRVIVKTFSQVTSRNVAAALQGKPRKTVDAFLEHFGFITRLQIEALLKQSYSQSDVTLSRRKLLASIPKEPLPFAELPSAL